MTTAQAEALSRATIRARRYRLTVLAGTWKATGRRAFAVHSSAGRTHYYLLKVEAGRIRCECPGSQHGRICKHAAAVRLFLVEEREARERAEHEARTREPAARGVPAAQEELASWYRDFLAAEYPAPGYY